MNILRQATRRVVKRVMAKNVAWRRVGPQTKGRLLSQSVLEDWCLPINVCGQAHHVCVCVFFFFFLFFFFGGSFHYSICDYVCCTVMFIDEEETSPVRTKHVCNLELRPNKGLDFAFWFTRSYFSTDRSKMIPLQLFIRASVVLHVAFILQCLFIISPSFTDIFAVFA